MGFQNWRNGKEAPGAREQGAKEYEVGERLELSQITKCPCRARSGLRLCSNSHGNPLRNLSRRVSLPALHF